MDGVDGRVHPPYSTLDPFLIILRPYPCYPPTLQTNKKTEQRRVLEDVNKVTNEGLHYDYDKAEDKSFRVVDSGTGKRKGACARVGAWWCFDDAEDAGGWCWHKHD